MLVSPLCPCSTGGDQTTQRVVTLSRSMTVRQVVNKAIQNGLTQSGPAQVLSSLAPVLRAVLQCGVWVG
jgi:hypothetical protein